MPPGPKSERPATRRGGIRRCVGLARSSSLAEDERPLARSGDESAEALAEKRKRAPSRRWRNVSGRLGFAGLECLSRAVRRFRHRFIAENPAVGGPGCLPWAEAGVP